MGTRTLTWLLAVAALSGGCRDEPPPVEDPHPAVEDPHPAVEGRWRSDLDEVELFPGGRLLLRQGAARALGRYEWVEADRVLIAYEGVLADAVPGDYRVGVEGNNLTLCETDVPVRCIHYERWREDFGTRAADFTPARLAPTPRADQMPREARMKEAESILKMAYMLQKTYRAHRGEYARNLCDLRDEGWETPRLRYFDAPRLIRSQGERFCITVEPRSPELWPMYVDESGEIREGRDCR